MKSTLMTLLVLIAITTAELQAQSANNTSGRRSTPTAQGAPSSKTSPQPASSAKNSGSTMGTGATHLQPAVGNRDSQASGSRSGRGSKAQGKAVNQQAAGVPPHTGSSGRNSGKPVRNP